MVFSLKNIDELGFGRRESSKFGSIVNRKWRGEQPELMNVWGSAGHIFVATNEGRDLHAFEFIPRSKWTPESEGLLLKDKDSPIVSVLSSKADPLIIYIVHKNSVTECWEYSQSNLKWIKKTEFQLSNTKGVEILSVVLHPLSSTFFWCERRSVSLSELVSCCVCMREVTFHERCTNGMRYSVGPLIAVLHSCPSMSLHIIGRSVCLVPDFPTDLRKFILFWNFIQRSLKVYVWNFGVVEDIDKTDFRAIISELLFPWIANIDSNNRIPAGISSHPTTNELIVLSSDAKLFYFVLEEGNPVLKELCKLDIDFTFQEENVTCFFSIGLNVGVVWNSGVIFLFEIPSGIHLSSLEELRGQEVHIWKSFHLTPSIGFWSVNGIWKLQSPTVLEIASHMKSISVIGEEFPTTSWQSANGQLEVDLKRSQLNYHIDQELIATRTVPTVSSASGVTFETLADQGRYMTSFNEQTLYPQERVFERTLFAASYLTKWRMMYWAAKLALDSVVCHQFFTNWMATDTEIPRGLLDLFVDKHAQSPIFALALLYKHPVHRNFVLCELEKCMARNAGDSETGRTVVTELLQPFLSEFLMLSRYFKSTVTPGLDQMTVYPTYLVNSVVSEVERLLETYCSGVLDLKSLERLSMLSLQHQKEVLICVSQYLSMGEQRKDESCSDMEKKWKKVYRLEWRNGHWQRSRIALKEHHNAMLSILSRLFYNSNSEHLMGLVQRGMDTVQAQVSDEQTEEYINQSVMDCLPVLSTRSNNPKSVLAHSQLLHTNGQETHALRLLLSHHMWQQSISFVSCCGKNSEKRNVLFVMLIKGLQSGRVPGEMLVEALRLAPKGFNTQELLSLMRDQTTMVKEPFAKGAGETTVGEIRPFLEMLLTSYSL